MTLTTEQIQKLGTLSCERLSANQKNFDLVEEFYNAKNGSLVDTLKNEAYDDDEHNRIAYYVVKDGRGDMVFFFSLKCGLLYDEFIEGDRLKEMQSFYAQILKMCKDESLSKEEKLVVNSLLEQVRSKKGIKKEDVAKVLHFSQDSDEFSKIFVKNLKNVGRTFAGVEIVHFCANDGWRDNWNSWKIPMKLGSYIFWKFVVKTVIELMKFVGCEYLFLFAADLTEDEELIKYYQDQLGFELVDEHCAAIPIYDFTCRFMSQKASELVNKRVKFFEHYCYTGEI